MARKRKGSPVHGWVVLDKPRGITSTQAVSRVRRLFDAQKAGHAGTLDPLATGVLAIALGEATKTVPYAMDGDKLYRFTARWGEARDTDDAEGKVVARSDARPSESQIGAAIPGFVGEIMQVPPAYSAIKVDGERAYDLAREGEEVVLEARPIHIHAARLVDMPDPDHAIFEVACGKGSYIRAWVRDLALALGTVGHVVQLRRLKVGPFTEETAISLEKLEALGHSPAALEHLRPIATALDGIPALAVTEPDSVRLRSGNAILIRAPQFARLTEGQADAGANLQGLTVYLSTARGEPVALAEVAQGELRPFRVFNFGLGI
ncbi:MAG: tRNA pseudouridine(55) synthase TruB [Alphaproteobacteria bacterium]|nr:tRNA pseudouridine(55) synthase TruB [Alphaproteobacteria bacterium]